MPTVFTPLELKAYFSGIKRSLVYDEAVATYDSLRTHADGEMPVKLIHKQRPNESDAVMTYRKEIYEPETQNPVERVLGVLEKIRRSADWMIRFDNDVPPIIDPEETLQKYLTEKYPVYGHFENWLFEEALRNLAIDANSIVIIMPKDLEVSPLSYVEPIACIFNANRIVDFAEEDFAIVKSEELSSLLTPEQQRQRVISAKALPKGGYIPAQVYYLVDTTMYQKWEETPGGKYQLTKVLSHGLNELPAFQVPGKFVKRVGAGILKKTLLAPMVPHLNKAARESNDLDAGVVMHLYLEKWRINNVPCPACNGVGKVATPNAGPVDCKPCGGSGMANGKSPFNEIVIKPAAIGQQNVPIPPMGYVDKNVEIIKVQSERIEQHLYKALSSVNMEHLAEVMLNQSGVSKQYDRDEINNTIYSFADSIVTIANKSIMWISELRYQTVVSNADERKKLRPVVPVPEKFDVINTSYLFSEYQAAKTAGLNNAILDEMQKELASKKLYANPKVAAKTSAILDCDPFPSKTIEEKALMAGQGLATKEDVILSNYISDFVNQAMEDDKTFLEKSKSQKRDILLAYAKKKVTELSTASAMSQDIFGDGNAGQGNAQNGGQNADQNGGQAKGGVAA